MRARTIDLSMLQARGSDAAALLRALGNERRLMLLCLLIENGELSAGVLAEGIELAPSAASQPSRGCERRG